VAMVVAVPVTVSLHGTSVDALAALAGRAAATGSAAASRGLRHHLVDVDGLALVDAATGCVVHHQRLEEKQAQIRGAQSGENQLGSGTPQHSLKGAVCAVTHVSHHLCRIVFALPRRRHAPVCSGSG